MKTYRTHEIAKIANVHSNTIRLYEKYGIISPVEREKNNYRIYTEKHLYQVKICRCIYDYGWIGKKFRIKTNEIIQASVNWKLEKIYILTNEYIKLIKEELKKAKKTMKILEKWSKDNKNIISKSQYNRIETAKIIGATPETLRSWERSDLIKIPRKGTNKKRVYGEKEIERLRIIYMLRQSKFSVQAIYNSMKKFDLGEYDDVLPSLSKPNTFGLEDSNWINVGDRWLDNLEDNLHGAEQILELIKEMKKIKIQ